MDLKVFLFILGCASVKSISVPGFQRNSQYAAELHKERNDQISLPSYKDESKQNSGEAVSSQSYVRHDVPLSYKMVATHPRLYKSVAPKPTHAATQPTYENTNAYQQGPPTEKYSYYPTEPTDVTSYVTPVVSYKQAANNNENKDKEAIYTQNNYQSSVGEGYATQQKYPVHQVPTTYVHHSQTELPKSLAQYYQPSKYYQQNEKSAETKPTVPLDYFLPTQTPTQGVHQYAPIPKNIYYQSQKYKQPDQQSQQQVKPHFIEQQQNAYNQQFAHKGNTQPLSIPVIVQYVTPEGSQQSNLYPSIQKMFYVLPSNGGASNNQQTPNYNTRHTSIVQHDQIQNGAAHSNAQYQSPIHSYNTYEGLQHLPSVGVSSQLAHASFNQAKSSSLKYPELSNPLTVKQYQHTSYPSGSISYNY